MKLTKDEARLLGNMLADYKYELQTSVHINEFIDPLTVLENKLQLAGCDHRRQGRTTQDSFDDCLKRIIKKHQDG